MLTYFRLFSCADFMFKSCVGVMNCLIVLLVTLLFAVSASAHPDHEDYAVYYSTGLDYRAHSDSATGACQNWARYYYYPAHRDHVGEVASIVEILAPDGRVAGYEVTCFISAYNWLYKIEASTEDRILAFCNLPTDIYNNNFLYCQPEENTLTCDDVGNPIFAGTGEKAERASDWVSPLDARFAFQRDYRSDADQRDQTVFGFGEGWSSQWGRRIERDRNDQQSRIVMFGDSVVHHFTGATLTVPKSGDHGYRLEMSVATEQSRHAVTHPSGQLDIYEDISTDVVLLSEMRWPDGYAMTLSRDASNNVSAISDNRGQRAELTWNTTLNADVTVPVVTQIDIAYFDSLQHVFQLAFGVDHNLQSTPLPSWNNG